MVMGNSRTAFRPNEDITRAELTAMAVRFFEVVGNKENFKNTGTYTVFNDVASGYWAAEYIENAALYGWVQGYGNGSFKGEAFVAKNTRKLNSFTDMYAKHWAYEAIMEAANGHTAVLENEAETWER